MSIFLNLCLFVRFWLFYDICNITKYMSLFERYSLIKLDDVPDDIKTPEIPDIVYITDKRTVNDFKQQTFGGYGRNNVMSALDKAILQEQHEAALHWAFQLFFSGIIMPLWDKFITLAVKQINISNPTLPLYIYIRQQQWDKLYDLCKETKNQFALRNHPEMRNLLTDIVITLSMSRKRKLDCPSKIGSSDFTILQVKQRSVAQISLIDDILLDGDPSEVRMVGIELAHHLMKSNTKIALYWIAWLLEWDAINVKRYKKFECGLRVIPNTDAKYHHNVVWFIWDIIKKILKKRHVGNTNIECQVTALWELFIYRFNSSSRSKRQMLLYLSAIYITELIDWSIPLVTNPACLFQGLFTINKLISNMKMQCNTPTSAEQMAAYNQAIKDNTAIPENVITYVKGKKQLEKEKYLAELEAESKKKKVSPASLMKMRIIEKMDSATLGE